MNDCHTEGERVVWVSGFGWTCSYCGFGIHRQAQTAQIDVTAPEVQLDMFG